VWEEWRKIPPRQTVSYAHIAHAIGAPTAVRAETYVSPGRAVSTATAAVTCSSRTCKGLAASAAPTI
jgi:O6-methylguanine-DNA--protein-cysteine methyltransferase